MGLWLAVRRAESAHLSTRSLMPVFAASLCSGFMGARLAYFLQCGGVPFRGGFVLYGGLILGLLGGLGTARLLGLPFLRLGDLSAPCVLIATAIGRLGCTLAGCCYGRISEMGIAYPRGSHPFRDQMRQGLIDANAKASLPTVPIVLLESLVLVLLFMVTSGLWRRRTRPGTVLAVAGMLYPAWRFVAEYFRADNLPYWGASLTFSQGISLACLAGSGMLLFAIQQHDGASRELPGGGARATLPQWLGMLAFVALSFGGLSCASHVAANREISGQQPLRHQGPAKPSSSNPKNPSEHPAKDSSDDPFSDCLSDCVSDCTAGCIEDCTDALCSEESSCGKSDEGPFRSILGTLQPGKKYKGALGFEGVVNDRLKVVLHLEGLLSVRKALRNDNLPIHLRLSSIDLTVDQQHWHGQGDLSLEVSPSAVLTVVNSSLPEDLRDALASLDGITGNFIDVPSGIPPATELRKRIQAELGGGNPRAGFSMVTTFEGHEKWLTGDGKVVEEPPGTYFLQWSIRD